MFTGGRGINLARRSNLFQRSLGLSTGPEDVLAAPSSDDIARFLDELKQFWKKNSFFRSISSEIPAKEVEQFEKGPFSSGAVIRVALGKSSCPGEWRNSHLDN